MALAIVLDAAKGFDAHGGETCSSEKETQEFAEYFKTKQKKKKTGGTLLKMYR